MSLLNMKNFVLVVVTLMVAPCVFMAAGAKENKVGCDRREKCSLACKGVRYGCMLMSLRESGAFLLFCLLQTA